MWPVATPERGTRSRAAGHPAGRHGPGAARQLPDAQATVGGDQDQGAIARLERLDRGGVSGLRVLCSRPAFCAPLPMGLVPAVVSPRMN